jgi:hypothetical protein
VVAFCCCDKIPEKINLRRKGWFWITVSEVSVCGHLALVSGPVRRLNIMVGSGWWSKAAHCTMEREREKERRDRETKYPIMGTSS